MVSTIESLPSGQGQNQAPKELAEEPGAPSYTLRQLALPAEGVSIDFERKADSGQRLLILKKVGISASPWSPAALGRNRWRPTADAGNALSHRSEYVCHPMNGAAPACHSLGDAAAQAPLALVALTRAPGPGHPLAGLPIGLTWSLRTTSSSVGEERLQYKQFVFRHKMRECPKHVRVRVRHEDDEALSPLDLQRTNDSSPVWQCCPIQ